ncbi:AAA-12 multi-domain protein [Pyrenophora tritici-repentis]|nr:AAA-12 multi-domain protein [Pyrenophora tritici-repentis]
MARSLPFKVTGNMFSAVDDVTAGDASPAPRDALPPSAPRKKSKYAHMLYQEDEEIQDTGEIAPATTMREHVAALTGDGDVSPFLEKLAGYDLNAIHKEYRGSDKPDIGKFRYRRQTDVQTVNYVIFANCIRPADGQQDAGISMNMFHEPMDSAADVKDFGEHIARGHNNFIEFAVARNLMMTNINLIKPKEVNAGDYRRRPIWSGLTTGELENIRAKGTDATLVPDMDDFERTILFLDRAVQLAVFRRIEFADMPTMKKFENFFFGSMHLCSKYRNFWYYQLQLEKPHEKTGELSESADIFNSKCNLEKLQPPRWMSYRFPSVQDCAFLVRLALARERNSQKMLIEKMSASTKGDCKALLESIDGLKGGYYVKIRLPGTQNNEDDDFELVKPILGTRVMIHVSIMCGEKISYEGQVVEAPGSEDIDVDESKDFDFVVHVIGRPYEFGTTTHVVNIEYIDDKTTADRARIATENMASMSLKRTEGVDMQGVIFRTQPTIAPENLNAGRDMHPETLCKVLEDVKTKWRLKKTQIDAVKETLVSDNGLALIYGSPGTGKTTTTAAAAHEHCEMGRKVIYVCNSNKTVDAALDSFRKKQNPKISAIRFVGGYQTYEKYTQAVVPGANLEELVSAINPTMTAAMKANPDTLFHVQLRKQIDLWAAAPEHKMHREAKDYVEKLAADKNTKASDNTKASKGLQEMLTQWFVEHNIDIIFTTCSSASHSSIQHFKPSSAFIDEAGHATIPDVCMAVDPFKEHVKSLTLSSDYNLLKPIITTWNSNEARFMLTDSLFRQLINDPDRDMRYVTLREQYRQHPDLSAWAIQTLYQGRVKDAPSASQVTPVGRTVRQVFQQMGTGRKNKRCRMAIDVSGDDAVSKHFKDTTSYCNSEEARIIVGLVRGLLAFKPNHTAGDEHKFARIQPAHINIITPYKGQQHIRNMLMEKVQESSESEVLVKMVTDGAVNTTWGTPGSDVDIVFISLCVRNPKKAMANKKFIALGNALCVQNTRARQFQVTCGNWNGWLEAAMESTGGRIASDHHKPFVSLTKDIYHKGDMVAWQDVDATLLAQTPVTLKASHFYTNVRPNINAEKYRADLKKPTKRKQGGSAYSMSSIRSDLPSSAASVPVPDQPKTVSNRELKRRMHAAKHAKDQGV